MKINKIGLLVTSGVVLSAVAISILFANVNLMNQSVQAESTLQRTITLEDLTAGNMSATATGISYYDGLIVADGKITTTQTARIDENTLGMRIPANSLATRNAKINVSGYTKIVVDLVQARQMTIITTGCSDPNGILPFQAESNGQILRDVEISTHGYHEINITFSTTESVTSNLDCGIDNIRFYGPGSGGTDSSSSSSTSSTSEDSDSSSSSSTDSSSSTGPAREDTPYIIDGKITMRAIADYLDTKDTYYPISNLFIESYQQASGGYIAYAKQVGHTVNAALHEPNQKWHFFDSWLYRSIEDGTLTWDEAAQSRVSTKLLCPELLLWIYEACEVPTAKVQAAYDVAVEGKIAGTTTTTIAKNMRGQVAWTDLEPAITNYINAQA